MIAIIDYGMGNLRSVQKACEYLGFEALITNDQNDLKNASKLILPGVGAFEDAMKHLKRHGLITAIQNEVKKGKYFLGICLGMQLLFDKSYENGAFDGFGLIKGEVTPFDVPGMKVPHMGWNKLVIRDNPLFINEEKDQYVYFVHSYHASSVPEQNIIAQSEYGYVFCAAVMKDNVFGLQFHPEKSGDTGLKMLKKFGGLT